MNILLREAQTTQYVLGRSLTISALDAGGERFFFFFFPSLKEESPLAIREGAVRLSFFGRGPCHTQELELNVTCYPNTSDVYRKGRGGGGESTFCCRKDPHER